MLLSAVSVLVVGQSSSEIPEGFMNNPVLLDEADTVKRGVYNYFKQKLYDFSSQTEMCVLS